MAPERLAEHRKIIHQHCDAVMSAGLSYAVDEVFKYIREMESKCNALSEVQEALSDAEDEIDDLRKNKEKNDKLFDTWKWTLEMSEAWDKAMPNVGLALDRVWKAIDNAKEG